MLLNSLIIKKLMDNALDLVRFDGDEWWPINTDKIFWHPPKIQGLRDRVRVALRGRTFQEIMNAVDSPASMVGSGQSHLTALESEISSRNLYVTLALPVKPRVLKPGLAHSGYIMLTHAEEPTSLEITSILRLNNLQLKFHTMPIRYNSFGFKSPLFRFDGRINIYPLYQHISPRVRLALRNTKIKEYYPESLPPPTSGRARFYRKAIIYIRQSTASQGDDTMGIETAFVCLVKWLVELVVLELLQDLVIIVEYCSSSIHPMESRKMMDILLNDHSEGPILLLTNNPDRVTKRPDELTRLLEHFGERIIWMSLGTRNNTMDMVRVTAQVGDQLGLALQRSTQQQVYMGAIQRMVNYIQVPSVAPQLLQSLRDLIYTICQDYDDVVVLSRTSITTNQDEDRQQLDSLSSIERQVALVEVVLARLADEIKTRPNHPIRIRTVNSCGRSAYDNSAMEELDKIITSIKAGDPTRHYFSITSTMLTLCLCSAIPPIST
eukprot:gene7778-9126_t